MSGAVQYGLDMTPLKSLRVSAKDAASAEVRVGILGNYADRQPGASGTKRRAIRKIVARVYNSAKKKWVNKTGTVKGPNNPTLGAIHEFGSMSRGIPSRSWLRMPVFTKLPGEIAKDPPDVWAQLLLQFGFVEVLREVGERAVAVIKDAFHTGGFGTWRALSKATIKRKGNANILIDTGQLRSSVTYAVVDPKDPRKPL